jgi:hypothetical protein
VREVDLADTELAVGDDDGFLAVVLANRLPQFDRVHCQPVRYMACLINIEGQYADLPEQDDFVTSFDPSVIVQDVRLLAADQTLTADQYVMGKSVSPIAGAINADFVDRAPNLAAAPTFKVQSSVTAAAPAAPVAQSWQTTQTSVNQIAVSAAPEEAGRLVRDAMTAGFRFPIEVYLREKRPARHSAGRSGRPAPARLRAAAPG